MVRHDPPIFVLMTCCLSHVAMVPAVLQLFQRKWMYESFVALFNFVASFMYHTCQALHVELFLSELQWHRLDNVGSLLSFGMFCIYLSGVKDPVREGYMKYGTMLVTLLSQERDPWNLTYTMAPVLLFSAIPLSTHAAIHRRVPAYDWKNFTAGFGLLAVALPFFVAGLDDDNDPFRFYHGMWHVLAGVASLYLWRIVKSPGAVALQPLTDKMV